MTVARDAARLAALTEARRWLGTPYVHQASAIGAGADCLGVLRGVWRALYGPEPERAPDYRADWAEMQGGEHLLAALARWLDPLPVAAAQAGDVLLWRMRRAGPAKHAAIISANFPAMRVIHAYSGHAVVETAPPPTPPVAAFGWPPLPDGAA